jgi:hypothetical protein
MLNVLLLDDDHVYSPNIGIVEVFSEQIIDVAHVDESKQVNIELSSFDTKTKQGLIAYYQKVFGYSPDFLKSIEEMINNRSAL